MIDLIEGMPENVVAVTASGKVTGKDYDDVLITAVERKLATLKKIRLLYHIGAGFTGFTAEAIWNDAKIGLWHVTEFERIAVVSDVEWIRSAVRLFRFIVPCPMKIFANSELEEAKSWISS